MAMALCRHVGSPGRARRRKRREMLQGWISLELLSCAVSWAMPALTPNPVLEHLLSGEGIQMRKGSKPPLDPPEMPHLDKQGKQRHQAPGAPSHLQLMHSSVMLKQQHSPAVRVLPCHKPWLADGSKEGKGLWCPTGNRQIFLGHISLSDAHV